MPAAELSDPWPLRLLACIDADRGLGKNGHLLASVPEDMARFRQLTMGQVVIMGRGTMESLPGRQPLRGRVNIVLSRTLPAEDAQGFLLCRSLAELWTLLGKLARRIRAAYSGALAALMSMRNCCPMCVRPISPNSRHPMRQTVICRPWAQSFARGGRFIRDLPFAAIAIRCEWL